MALSAAFLSEDHFTCSICLDVFTDPVSTACGHSFCRACIYSYWGRNNRTKPCLCPLCKVSFRKRPDLQVNRTLKEITEQFKQLADMTAAGPAATRESGGGGREAEEERRSSALRRPHRHNQPPPPSLRPGGTLGGMPGSVSAESMTRRQRPAGGRVPPPPPPLSRPHATPIQTQTQAAYVPPRSPRDRTHGHTHLPALYPPPRSGVTLDPASGLADSTVGDSGRLPCSPTPYCLFCRRNGTHFLKAADGRVTCPNLRRYVCRICQATGDSAHTARHCPRLVQSF